MKIYKKLTFVAMIIAAASLATAMIMHYILPCTETDFWINVCLGIFGSAFLTILTSIIFYNHEKENTLEGFLNHTKQILTVANKYQEHMTLEEKIRFFLEYSEFDKIAWDADFGNMSFFSEKITHNQKYIYCSIYKPILDFNQAVANHVWHFRWHLDGSGKNDAVMQKFVGELQGYLLRITEQDIPTEYDDDGNVISSCHHKSTEPKLVSDVKKELGGRYYEIMHRKRKAAKLDKELNEQEAQPNGQDEI